MKIPCSNCGQRLDIPEELAGQTIDCPACGTALAVPALAPQPPPAAPPKAARKTSPQRRAASKGAKRPMPKWAIGAVAAVTVLVGIIVFLSGGSSGPSIPAEVVQQGDIKQVRKYLDDRADVDGIADGAHTPLHHASSWGQGEIAKLLIDKGADVNAKGTYGQTPLILAAMAPQRRDSGDHAEIARILLSKGAKVNAIRKITFMGAPDGQTPLDFVYKRDEELADLLRSKGGKRYRDLDPEEIKAASTESKTPSGKNPGISIHEAATNGDVNAVQWHLDNGTDVDAKNEADWTPLVLAVENMGKNSTQHMEVAKLLINKGADVNAINIRTRPNGWGESHLLFGLVRAEANELIELMIKKGADVNAPSGLIGAVTPLDEAINEGLTDTAELLRKHGGKTSE